MGDKTAICLVLLTVIFVLVAFSVLAAEDKVIPARKQPGGFESKMMNIAHRGARSIAPENTLVAGRKAYEAGADAWEFDVQLTKDEKLVIVHDDTLERTTDAERAFPGRGSYKLKDFTLAEIKELDAGSWFLEEDPFGEIGKGSVNPGDLESYRGEEVPTLEEALQLTKELGWKANVEVKPIEAPAILVDKYMGAVLRGISDLVEELEMEEDVLVSSFDHVAMRKLKDLNPKLNRAILADGPLVDPVRKMRENGVRTLNLIAAALETREGIANLEEIEESITDPRVFVWTINEPADMRKAVKIPQVTGIMTDYPERLAEIIAGGG